MAKNVSITPYNKRIVVKRLEAPTVSSGGIIIPEAAKEKPKTGTVVAVASGIVDLQVGDTVLFTAFAGTEVKHQNEVYLILNADDVLAIVGK